MSKKISGIEVRVPVVNTRQVARLVAAFTGFMPSLDAFGGTLGGRLVLAALGVGSWESDTPYAVAISHALALCERSSDYPGSVSLQRNRGLGLDPDHIWIGADKTRAESWGGEPSDVVTMCPHTSPRRLKLWRSADGREVVLDYDFTERPSERIAQAVLDTVRQLISEDLPDPLSLAAGRPYESSISLRVFEVTEEVSPTAEPRPFRRASFRADVAPEEGEPGQ